MVKEIVRKKGKGGYKQSGTTDAEDVLLFATERLTLPLFDPRDRFLILRVARVFKSLGASHYPWNMKWRLGKIPKIRDKNL